LQSKWKKALYKGRTTKSRHSMYDLVFCPSFYGQYALLTSLELLFI